MPLSNLWRIRIHVTVNTFHVLLKRAVCQLFLENKEQAKDEPSKEKNKEPETNDVKENGGKMTIKQIRVENAHMDLCRTPYLQLVINVIGASIKFAATMFGCE